MWEGEELTQLHDSSELTSVNYGRFLSSSEGIRFPESDVSWDVNLKQMQLKLPIVQ